MKMSLMTHSDLFHESHKLWSTSYWHMLGGVNGPGEADLWAKFSSEAEANFVQDFTTEHLYYAMSFPVLTVYSCSVAIRFL